MVDEVNHADSSHICVGCSNLFVAPTGPAVVPGKHEAVSFTAIQDESQVLDFSVMGNFSKHGQEQPHPLWISNPSLKFEVSLGVEC
jgi:hypothetical protein